MGYYLRGRYLDQLKERASLFDSAIKENAPKVVLDEGGHASETTTTTNEHNDPVVLDAAAATKHQ